MRLVLVVALFAAVGCKVNNPNYCPEDKDEQNCNNLKPDAAMRCEGNGDCTGDTAKVCKLDVGICVECLDSSTCTSATEAFCDTATNRCVGCRSHADCTASNACLPDGSCADPLQVAYVSPTGTGTACTMGTPCGTLTDALATTLPVVKMIGPGIIDDDKLTTIDRAVTIVADPGARLERTTSGSILQISSNNANVKIYDLQITRAIAGNAIIMPDLGEVPRLTLERVAIHTNAGIGIKIDAGKVLIRRSIVSGNTGGGASITNADFELTNNLFVANGNNGSATGGLTLSPATASYVFQFNTVADNNSSTQGSSNINCAIAVKLSNSIIKGNRTSPNCTFDYTLFDPGTTVTGTNLAGDPAFRNVDSSMPTSPTYYRTGVASMAVDHADPNATEVIDVDGDLRPQGAGPDMGADEVRP